jgi:hypothetical protein
MPIQDLFDDDTETLSGGGRAMMRHRDRHPIHAGSQPVYNIANLTQTITNTITQINIANIIAAINSRVLSLQGNNSDMFNVMV